MNRVRPPKLYHAIRSLQPNAQFSYDNGDYNTLKWYDDSIPKPTEEECNTELARLQAEYDAKAYQRNRQPEYPDIGDQLDDLFKAGAFSTEMAAKIQAVKDKYPKDNT